MNQDTAIGILLVDSDPIFRLGLRTGLAEFLTISYIEEAATTTDALQALADTEAIGTIVLELALDGNPETGIDFCQQLQTEHPKVPILLVTAVADRQTLLRSQAVGVRGYCPKGTPLPNLVAAIQTVAKGESYWQQLPETAATTTSLSRQPTTGLLAQWRYQRGTNHLQQIDLTLRSVRKKIRQSDMNALERMVFQGRQRELLAARWLVQRLWSTKAESPPSRRRRRQKPSSEVESHPSSNTNSREAIESQLPVPQSPGNQQAPVTNQQSVLFDSTLRKIQTNVTNPTETVLEIDILRADKKRELLYIILREFENLLKELQFSQIKPEQVEGSSATVVRDLWQTATTEFFGKYYTIWVGDREVNVVSNLLQDEDRIVTNILAKIPFVPDLLAYFLFQQPLPGDNTTYAAGSLAAKQRAEILLDNIIISVGNAVVSPLLNQFADIEDIKNQLFNRSIVSTREIEEFRNNLTWKYRLSDLVYEPKQIFESRYILWTLNEEGMRQISVYAPRRDELEQLSVLPLAVTYALEIRDAIAPRLRATVSFVGSGLVYILTQVIGRGIGLIARGIIQGIGSSWQDLRTDKKKKQNETNNRSLR
jgi:DNA-binding NarL/FixJ family response regulator